MAKTFKAAPGGMGLWKHQQDAVDFAVDHLNRVKEPCLVRMPTGTGKTGVIATLTMLCADGRTLIITPWTNLRDQVVQSLRKNFWARLGRRAPEAKVVELFPKTIEDVLKDGSTKVMVCTFAALNDIRRDRRDLYDKLATFIELVVVDEGHYEPAVEWGRSVKGLNVPTVLLTATPYRNDLKLFRITDVKKNVYEFLHEDAETSGIVRRVRFDQLDCEESLSSLTTAFKDYWLKARRERALAAENPRAIICCHDAQAIEGTVQLLTAAGLKAIGVHETFGKKRNSQLLVNVPGSENPAEIWVHQYKLMEGLDDHRFCCVALFAPIRNDRKLIQQIGRILRVDENDRPNVPAVVLSPKQYEVESRWSAYRDFERNTTVRDAEYFKMVVQLLLDQQPSTEYFEGRFRRRFEPSLLDKDPQVAIAPSVLVRAIGQSFSFDEYIEQCTDTLNLEDAVILGPNPNAPCQRSGDHALWVYASVANSRLLAATSLYEISLEVHCVVVSHGFLLISDTKGIYPEAVLEEATTGLSADQLSTLLDSSFRVTNVSLSSVVPFDTVPRGADLRGHDISGIAASLTDKIQICRSARGASAAAGRRYVGMNRGRVRNELSEADRQSHVLADFVAWAHEVAATITRAKPANTVFSRFMQSCNPPADPRPQVISLDLQKQGINLLTAEGSALEPVASSVNIRPGGSLLGTNEEFTLEFKRQGEIGKERVKLTLEVEYQKLRKRFWFKSSKEAPVYVEESVRGRTVRKSFAEYLNRNQSIALIGLRGGDVIYQGTDFYSIDYSSAERTLLSRITPLVVPRCTSEKGSEKEIEQAKTDKVSAFVKGSLFRLIATSSAAHPFTPELIVCDDLSSECGDFLLANFTERRLALVHAKVGDGSGISASAFHDVVSQAMKNLAYLTRNAPQPKGAKSWSRKVYWNNTRIPRLYKGPHGLTGEAIWKKIRTDIIDTANADLHVILATAGCCNLGRLREAIREPSKRTAETAQLIHLLEGLNSYARTLGVQLSIYDVPLA